MALARIPTCHPERKHKAKGLCSACYQAASRWQNNVKSKCHPDRAHAAMGLCKPCYMRSYLNSYKRPIDSVIQRKEMSWRARGMNFSLVEYHDFLSIQKGRCAICGKEPTSSKGYLRADHDHVTGRIRGLLCDYCNRRLLVPRNTPEILDRAAQYLRNGDFSGVVAANTPAQ